MDKVDQSRKRKAEGDDDFESKSKSAYLVSEFIALRKLLSRKRSPPSDDRAKGYKLYYLDFYSYTELSIIKKSFTFSKPMSDLKISSWLLRSHFFEFD